MSAFEVGSHKVQLRVQKGRWLVTVDRRPLSGRYDSEADAWTAGVQEADRLDRSSLRTVAAEAIPWGAAAPATCTGRFTAPKGWN
jgi:hypothetical protein